MNRERARYLVMVIGIGIAMVALQATAAVARQDDAVASLQGRWVVTAGEHNAEPMDSLNGGVFTIDGATFEIRTVSGNALSGTLRVDGSMQPQHLDFLHADGTHWEAVVEVDGSTMRLNYVDASGLHPRPTGFKTLATNEESLLVLRREDR